MASSSCMMSQTRFVTNHMVNNISLWCKPRVTPKINFAALHFHRGIQESFNNVKHWMQERWWYAWSESVSNTWIQMFVHAKCCRKLTNMLPMVWTNCWWATSADPVLVLESFFKQFKLSINAEFMWFFKVLILFTKYPVWWPSCTSHVQVWPVFQEGGLLRWGQGISRFYGRAIHGDQRQEFAQRGAGPAGCFLLLVVFVFFFFDFG